MGLVHVKNALKKFEQTISVDHVSLAVNYGEIYGLLGPNGAGKSTLIHMISGLILPDQGEIVIDGSNMVRNPLDAKRKIGLVPQDIAIYESLTALENAMFFGRLYGLKGSLLKERAEEALSLVGLDSRKGERAGTFSGGLKRRLNIACALVHRPSLIIMDEPTAGIDPHSRNFILESIKQLNAEGASVLYTSHYLDEVAQICSRVGIMDRGQLIAQGTLEELREQVVSEEQCIFQVEPLKEAAVMELKKYHGVAGVHVEGDIIHLACKASEIVFQDILFIFYKHGIRIKSMHRKEPDLEALFLTLTGRGLRD